jgi:hypothetical protein
MPSRRQNIFLKKIHMLSVERVDMMSYEKAGSGAMNMAANRKAEDA